MQHDPPKHVEPLVPQASHPRRPKSVPLSTHTKDHSMTAWHMSNNQSQLYACTRRTVLFTFTVTTAFEKNNSNCHTIFTFPYVQDATRRCGTRVSLFYAQKHKKSWVQKSQLNIQQIPSVVFRACVINQFISLFTEDSSFIMEDTVTCKQTVIKHTHTYIRRVQLAILWLGFMFCTKTGRKQYLHFVKIISLFYYGAALGNMWYMFKHGGASEAYKFTSH